MSYSPKLLTAAQDRLSDVLVGRNVVSVPVSGKSDLSDWIELMEVVEALCPVWPARELNEGGDYKL